MTARVATATPFDNMVGLWHHWGRQATSRTIDDFARSIQQRAPAVKAVYIKSHHGPKWMSEWGDTSPFMAISGPASIDRWVNTLAKYGMEFHAWCVPEGLDIEGESQKIIDVCNRPGVKSVILDVEPYSGFYEGPRESVRPLMTRVRANIPSGFHIAMSVDPRPQHFRSIFPDEWFPFVNSILPQVYWRTFQQTPDRALADCYNTWRGYGRPIYPILQVDSPAAQEMQRARQLSISTYQAKGISWWLHSKVTDALWPVLNVAMDGSVPKPDNTEIPNVPTGLQVIVRPGDAGYRDGTYDGTPVDTLLQSFVNVNGWQSKFKQTSGTISNVWARWDPALSKTGWYEVSAFVPGTNATSNRARYKLHGATGIVGEQELSIPQDQFSDVWVPLAINFFDETNPTAGVVFLNDLTGEPDRRIAFDAIRWRELTTWKGSFVADGFDAPIGTAADRASARVWPGKWFDATGFATRYRIGTPGEAYHTGVDLNLNTPTWDADANSPFYAAASGVVTTVKSYPTWGLVIVVRHDPLAATGQVVYGRYAHGHTPRVREGQRVRRGDQLGQIGNADGTQPYHLHFDISPTDILATRPDHWPKLNLANLQANYIDPRRFVANNRPARRSG